MMRLPGSSPVPTLAPYKPGQAPRPGSFGGLGRPQMPTQPANPRMVATPSVMPNPGFQAPAGAPVPRPAPPPASMAPIPFEGGMQESRKPMNTIQPMPRRQMMGAAVRGQVAL